MVYDAEYDINKIEDKMKELKELHRAHTLPGFDDRREEEHKIQILTSEITSMFQQCYSKIKRIGGMRGSKKEDLMKKNVQSKLAVHLQDLTFQFKADQRMYLQTLRGLETAAGSGFEMQSYDSKNTRDWRFNNDQMKMLEESEQDADLWEEDSKRVLESVQELSEIFKDINILIIDQGTILDRIDFNLECSEENMSRANENLEEVIKKRNHWKKYLLIVLLLIIIGLGIGFIVKVSLGK